jgi:predicted CXXCH cytochrome family protein
MCLSCHDGVTALDAYGGAGGSTDMTDLLGAGDPAIVGTDLGDDHPISFTYDTALSSTDGELHDPNTTLSSLGGTITEDMLFGNSMECASCHDVHDNAIVPFLRMANSNSDLCLTCHDK